MMGKLDHGQIGSKNSGRGFFLARILFYRAVSMYV